MAPPITHPKTYRILCDAAAPIDVSMGGQIAAFSEIAEYPFNYYGDAGFIFANGGSFGILRVKTNGQFCWYSNCGTPSKIPVQSSYNPISTVFFIGKDTLRISARLNGGGFVTTTIVLPVYFQDGAFINLNAQSFATPAAPCNSGAAPGSIFYDSANGLMLVEYVNGFPDDYQLWASVFAVGAGNAALINGGYLGFYPNGTDPILNNSSLGDLYSTPSYGVQNGQFSYDQNGNLIGRDIVFKDLYGNFAVFCSNQIVAGNLNCAGNGYPLPQYNVQILKTLDSQSREFTGFNFQNQYQTNFAGSTDLPKVGAIANEYAALDLFDGTSFVELATTTGATFYYCNTAAYVGGKVITLVSAVNQINAPPYNVNILIATPKSSLPFLGPTPNANNLAHQLTNFHRPVSIFGAFKT